MKRLLSRLFALVLVAVIGLSVTACGNGSTMTGNYREDTMAVVSGLREAIDLPEGTPDKAAAQAKAKALINDFASRYRRDSRYSGLASFTTMQTALNSLAGHYASYPNRPIPEKLKTRLEKEFRTVEIQLKRDAAA